MSDKATRLLALMLGAAAMIAARRWRNPDPTAGLGIAGWTIFLVIVLL